MGTYEGLDTILCARSVNYILTGKLTECNALKLKNEINCTGDIREIYGEGMRKEIVQTISKVIEFRRNKIENG